MYSSRAKDAPSSPLSPSAICLECGHNEWKAVAIETTIDLEKACVPDTVELHTVLTAYLGTLM